MNELLIEIQEDIRRERFEKLWNSFGKTMVAISLAVILATIVIVMVQNHRRSRAMEQTAQFMTGIDRLGIEDYKGAIGVFGALAADASSPYYGMAMMHKAQAEASSGDKAAAEKTYAALAAHDTLFGALGQMLIPGASVQPDKDSPFYYTQSEWRAWQLLEQGKKDEAVQQFLSLSNNVAAPASLRDRVTEVLQHIAPEKTAIDTGAPHE